MLLSNKVGFSQHKPYVALKNESTSYQQKVIKQIILRGKSEKRSNYIDSSVSVVDQSASIGIVIIMLKRTDVCKRNLSIEVSSIESYT